MRLPSKTFYEGAVPTIIRLAQSPDDFAAVEALVRRYVEWLGLDLSFQSFEAEIGDLQGRYHPPSGGMFLAGIEEQTNVGCFGYSPIRIPGAYEAKRLFVLPEARGAGISKALMDAVLSGARYAGYEMMFLDTLPSMQSAIRLYEEFGFERTVPYYDNPIETAIFFSKSLRS